LTAVFSSRAPKRLAFPLVSATTAQNFLAKSRSTPGRAIHPQSLFYFCGFNIFFSRLRLSTARWALVTLPRDNLSFLWHAQLVFFVRLFWVPDPLFRCTFPHLRIECFIPMPMVVPYPRCTLLKWALLRLKPAPLLQRDAFLIS